MKCELHAYMRVQAMAFLIDYSLFSLDFIDTHGALKN